MAIDGLTSDFIYSANNEPQVVEAGYDNSEMSQEDFLSVLLADLKWQDPTDVNDISEFITNTVKLRELEVLNSFETSVQNFVSAVQSLSLFFASGLIGRVVNYEGDETFVQNGSGKISFRLSDYADTVKVYLIDSNGNVVDEQYFFNLSPGQDYDVEINNPELGTGYYKVVVEASYQNSPVSATVISQALVTGVKKEEDGVYLVTEASEIPLNQIVGIGG